MGNMIKVGMADLKVCKCPDALTTLGLGSCVGVALYDPVTKVSGLLHCMLPDSTQIRNNSNVAKFADTGIDEFDRWKTSGLQKAAWSQKWRVVHRCLPWHRRMNHCG